jgi:hypothetical protein
MTEDHRAASAPERQAMPPEDERRAQRIRLAELLGRLLARYWLRFGGGRRDAPETETPAPTQE